MYMSKLDTLFLKLKLFSRIREVNLFFSQTGEDVLINSVLQNKPNGFYIDIGAYDPYKYSNTYGLFARGWHGINIDPNPKSIEKFNQARPDDINLNIGISDKPEELTYYNFKEAAFNTFSKRLVDSYKTSPLSTAQIKVRRLDEVLNEYVAPLQKIDLMTIDTEGYDLNVLKSNNWNKYRPTVVAVEFDVNDNRIDKYMAAQKYKPVCNTILTKIFVDTLVK